MDLDLDDDYAPGENKKKFRKTLSRGDFFGEIAFLYET